MTAPPQSDLPGDPSWLGPAVDTALDPVIVMDPDGSVVEWNRQAEAVFGWTRAEAVGRPLATLIIPEDLREAHNEGLRRYLATGERKILNTRVEVEALRRNGATFPIELAITEARLDGRRLFIGFLRDIAERKRHEEWLRRRAVEAEFLYQATVVAAESESFEDALRSCIDIVRRVTGWPIGHALVPDRDEAALVSTGIWSATDPHLTDAFRAVTEPTRFTPGLGLPGRVWQTGEPLWVAAGDDVARYPRATVASALGIHSAFGFPIKIKGRVVAVLEFFTTEEREPDSTLTLLARTIGAQIGRLVERKLAEEQRQVLLNELAHRVKNTLAVVSAIANQTLRTSKSPEAFVQSFQARLQALAHAHGLLTLSHWEHADLRAIIEGALAAHGPLEERVELKGKAVPVPPKAALALSLVFHELATNAAKYGALSVPSGRVVVTWRFTVRDGLRVEWREVGGPAIESAPTAEGYGSTLIKLSVERDLGGVLDARYTRDGFECDIVVPIDPSSNEVGAAVQPGADLAAGRPARSHRRTRPADPQ
jgi:PAS domain S-box-containing protein